MAKTFRIQISILISFLLVLILACGSIIFYNFNKTSAILLQKVDTEIKSVTQNLQRATRDYLSPAKWLTQLLSLNLKDDGSIFENKKNVIDLSIEMLSLFPHISGFYIGDMHGNLLAIRQMLNQVHQHNKDNFNVPPAAAYEIRTIDRNAKFTKEVYEYIDHNGTTLAFNRNQAFLTHFDPRQRPWFIGAVNSGKFYWSDPYMFQISKQIGTTAASPVYDLKHDLKMIVSADITMYEISKLLRESRISPSSISTIISKDGYLIGYPNINELIQSKLMQNNNLFKIHDTQNPLLIKAFEYYIKTQNKAFVFVYKNKYYIARFIPFGQEFDKDWLILFVAPQHEFLGDANQITQIMVIISFIIVLIAAFLIFIIARNISHPIEKVAKELDSIKDLDIEINKPAYSRFFEINLMNNALISMKISLQNFSKFVPKDVVRKLIASGEGADLGGKRMNITILFSDIQGFSAISEQMTSEELALHLSNYFDELTKIILSEGGTIDKYIGDSIMAFWGAPIENEHHAFHACQSALKCIHKLKDLNQKWLQLGKPQFFTRFGLHTGEAIVGNVGSKDRLNYSAFGDSVNTASRLEGVNKVYGLYCLISEQVYNSVKHHFICRPIDIVNVVGKTQGLKVFELMGDINDLTGDQTNISQLATMTATALDYYFKRNFDEALKYYQLISIQYPNDTVAPLFIKRCQDFINYPPSAEWRGIFQLTTK